jgi:hypothetical protein
MLGAALSVPVFSGLTAEEIFAVGREVHAHLAARGGDSRWIFQTLDPHQNKTVTVMAELIIPETDTPGAKAARVNEFIDLVLTDWYPVEDRDRFLKGLADVDGRSQKAYGQNFVDCAASQQIEILKGLDAEATALREAKSLEMSWGHEIAPEDHFFQMMKWLTLVGYYTSEIGMTQELDYVIIPGGYAGCIPYEASTSLLNKAREVDTHHRR